MDKTFVRRKFFTGDPAQIKILSLLLVSMLAPMLFVGSALYFIVFKMLYEQPYAVDSVSCDLYPLMMKTNLAMVLGFVPLFFLIMGWGVVLSRRLTGPLQRLQREIEEIAGRGDFKARLGVRKHDYIKPLIDSINKLLSKFCEMNPR